MKSTYLPTDCNDIRYEDELRPKSTKTYVSPTVEDSAAFQRKIVHS